MKIPVKNILQMNMKKRKMTCKHVWSVSDLLVEKHEEDHLLVNRINQRNITKSQRNTTRNIIIKNPKNTVKNKLS